MNPETPESPAFGDVSAAVEPVLVVSENGSTPLPAMSTQKFYDFQSAARALKAAEDAYRAAQQAYAEAVKALSEEAVK